MRVDPWKRPWLAWLVCGAFALAAGALLAHDTRAESPAAAKASKKRARPAPQPSARAASRRHKPPLRAPRPKRRTRSAAEPSTSDVAEAPDEACHAQLRKAGVLFVKVLPERAPDVRLPIRLTGALAGVAIQGTGKNRVTHYLDCRLALALLRWAPQLVAAGITRIDHYSIYRREAEVGGTRKLSAHAVAMAIDAGRFHLRDGRVLTILESWRDKTKGADPCAARPLQSEDERLLRELVCDASRRGIFQTVVTPHHNPQHDNHVHLEVSGSFAPTWIH